MDSQNRDTFDDLLDGALKQYGNVETRLGLEGRVLANLAAQASRARARRAWFWAVAGISAVVVLPLWFGHLGALKSHSDVSVRVPRVVMAPRTLMPPVVKEASRRKESRPRRRVSPRSMTVAAEPKLQQFPSSRPISEQELLVAEYAVRYPREAMLVAQEQQNFEEQVRQAQRELQESLRNSENQER